MKTTWVHLSIRRGHISLFYFFTFFTHSPTVSSNKLDSSSYPNSYFQPFPLICIHWQFPVPSMETFCGNTNLMKNIDGKHFRGYTQYRYSVRKMLQKNVILSQQHPFPSQNSSIWMWFIGEEICVHCPGNIEHLVTGSWKLASCHLVHWFEISCGSFSIAGEEKRKKFWYKVGKG